MSNKVKDTLHELIKHMSKSEKRYFKVFSSRHTIGEENAYITLFDYIEGMNEYSEEKIFKHFKGEAFLNKFSITKKRLYDHIINSLDNFHSSASSDAQIFKLINSSDILLQKSLYQQGIKQLKSAEKIALKNNRFNLLNEINLKLKKIYESQGSYNYEELEDMLEKDIEYHRKSMAFDKIWNLKTRLFTLLSSKGISRSSEDLSQFKGIIDELVKSETTETLYFDTEYLINHIYSAYYFATNSFKDCFTHLEANLRLMEKHPEEMQHQLSKYISGLTNAIYVAYRLNKKEEIKELREKLRAISSNELYARNEDLQIKLFANFYSIELTILALEGQNAEAVSLIPLVENGLHLYGEKLSENRKAFFAFKIACIYFSVNEFHLSLKWINKLLNNKNLDQQEDIVSFAQLLCLLIHFEMKNTDFMPYVLRSTSKYLKSRNRLYEFEQHFLKFITKLSKINNEIDQEEMWFDFYEKLSELEDQDRKRVAYEYFDFISWAQAKAQRKSFDQLVKENKEKRTLA
ncbi:MAG: hypothetical protein K0R65_1279 [Crocinitomicaceae bacterium]|jgi:hypothetical protein|nr:hypothetical protein [Crocinitomicaceae bacterium]